MTGPKFFCWALKMLLAIVADGLEVCGLFSHKKTTTDCWCRVQKFWLQQQRLHSFNKCSNGSEVEEVVQWLLANFRVRFLAYVLPATTVAFKEALKLQCVFCLYVI